MGGVLLGLLVLVGFPFPFPEWERGKGRGSRRGKGGRPSPSPILTPMGGTPCGLSPLSPVADEAHDFPRGVPVTPRYSRKIREPLENILVSEYHLPIYQSLPLDHFETLRHVRDLIRDSKQSLVTKTQNS